MVENHGEMYKLSLSDTQLDGKINPPHQKNKFEKMAIFATYSVLWYGKKLFGEHDLGS